NAAEVETDYGHVLVYGVNDDILARFDFANVRLPAQELITEVDRLGGVALPCHPGRTNVGLCAHYETKPALEGVGAGEALNGGSRAANGGQPEGRGRAGAGADRPLRLRRVRRQRLAPGQLHRHLRDRVRRRYPLDRRPRPRAQGAALPAGRLPPAAGDAVSDS